MPFSVSQPTPEAFRLSVRETQRLVNHSKPFGVNITMTPNIDNPDLFAYARAAVEEGMIALDSRQVWTLAECLAFSRSVQ